MSTPLEDFISGILSSLVRAKAKADMVSLEVADIYRSNELLKNLPVPKVSIEEVEIEIKTAVEDVEEEEEIERENISKVTKNIVEKLLDTPYLNKYPGLTKLEEDPQKREIFDKRIKNIIKRKKSLSSEALLDVILDISKKENVKPSEVKKDAKEIVSMIKLPKFIPYVRPLKLKTLVTSSELKEVEPDKMITIKLKLYGEDLEWENDRLG